MYGAVLAACLSMPIGCVQESGTEYSGEETGGAATALVTLQVGAAGNVQTRAYGGDGAAIAGEFMNSLELFIVDGQGMVEKVIRAIDDPNFVSADNGKGGCETEYSTTVTLRTGAKTIYAFANLDGHADVEGKDFGEVLGGIKEGSLWADAGINDGTVLYNPASRIDLADVFIPMAARREVSIPVSDGTVRLELVRLVGKVRPRLTNEKGEDVRVTSLSIRNFADRVALFEGGDAGEVSFDKTRRFTLDYTVGAVPVDLYGTYGDDQVVLTSDDGKKMPEIYVNETDGSDPFQIELMIDEDNKMTGTTVATTVPRNHYLPLALNLSDFVLTVTAYVAPIGGYPVAVMTGPSLTDNYVAEVPEGCHFEVEGTFGRTDDTDMPVTSWAWTVPQASTGLVAVEDATAIPLVGWLSALPGKSVMLEFRVASPHAKKGTLTLTTVPLGDMDGYRLLNRRNLPGWTENAQKYERVNLGYIK